MKNSLFLVGKDVLFLHYKDLYNTANSFYHIPLKLKVLAEIKRQTENHEFESHWES